MHVREEETAVQRGGDGNPAGLEITERGAQKCKIVVRGKECEVGIPAEFSGPVKHAGLTAYKQGANLVRGECRKDFLNRVLDRGSLPRQDRRTRVCWFPATAELASAGTNPTIRLRVCTRSACGKYINPGQRKQLKISIGIHNLGQGERLTWMDSERLPEEHGLAVAARVRKRR